MIIFFVSLSLSLSFSGAFMCLCNQKENNLSISTNKKLNIFTFFSWFNSVCARLTIEISKTFFCFFASSSFVQRINMCVFLSMISTHLKKKEFLYMSPSSSDLCTIEYIYLLLSIRLIT